MLTLDGNKIKVKFDEGRKKVTPTFRGKQCFVLKKGEIVDKVNEIFDRQFAVLKIFFTPMEGKIEDYDWGKAWRKYSRDRCEEIGRLSKLVEATVAQNLVWMIGLAPRVYGLILIERNGKKYPAQVVEDATGQTMDDPEGRVALLERIGDHLKKFDIKICHTKLVGAKDFLDKRLIDFQGFRFCADTERLVKEYVMKVGRYGKGHYQSIEKLGLTSKPRFTEHRIMKMELDMVKWAGKRVLDLGCNIGAFCLYASERGAKRVLGVDFKEQVEAAQVLAFYLGHHNIDYKVMDIREDELIEKFDITLFLSMVAHVGMPDWIHGITEELFIFEENAKASKYEPEGYWEAKLSKWYKKVKLVGHTTDHNPKFPKAIFWGLK